MPLIARLPRLCLTEHLPSSEDKCRRSISKASLATPTPTIPKNANNDNPLPQPRFLLLLWWRGLSRPRARSKQTTIPHRISGEWDLGVLDMDQISDVYDGTALNALRLVLQALCAVSRNAALPGIHLPFDALLTVFDKVKVSELSISQAIGIYEI
jgi:hypothetical protein